MKKRRMKLLALMLTAAVTFTSVLPVGATATNGSEAPQQVTELTDPLDEGGGVTDNGQGNTDVSGDVQNGIDQTGDEQPGDLPAEPNHDAETAQDDHWTLEQAENKMIFRYYESVDGFAGYQKKWELDKQSGIWTYFEVQEDGTEAAATPKPYDEFDVNGTHVGLYETVGYLDEDLGAVTLVYAFASTEEGLKGYGGYWYQNENGCFTYYTTEADAEGDPDAKMAEGLQVPGSFLEGLNTIKDEDGEYTFWLDAEGRPLTNAWKIVVGEDENKTFCYFGEDGKMLTEGMPTGLQTIEGSNYWIGEDGKPETAVWKKLDGKYYYFDVNGVQTQDKTGLQKIDGSNYWVNKDGSYAKSKWIISGGKYYYFGANGKQTSKTGLQTINGKKYYVNKNGTVRKNTSVIVKGVRYFFGKDGKCTKSYKVYPEGWKQNATGWWYQKEDGSWPANCWYKVNGQKYYFDANGYMRTGWLALGNKWYYLTDSGAMAQGWVMINKTWYYLTPGSGVMKTGWYKVGNTWYYSNGSGAMQTGWLLLGNTWYYLTGSGAMAQGWTLVNGTWYYLNGSGAMQTGWLMTGGTWYYLNGNGAMAQGWLCLGGTWYYLTPGNGGMKTGWYMAGKEWYYSYGNGAMARNAWIDTYYYVGSSGAMLKDTTIGGYYVDKNGRWIPGYGTVNVNTIGNWEKTGSTYYFKKSNGTYAKNEYVAWNGNWYYLDGNGAMLTGWHYIRGYKMYFTASGALQQDVSGMVGGPYRLRVNRTKCQITVLAKDGSNGWTIPVKSITCSVGNPITLTPAGTFYIGDQDRWHILMGPSWGQWTSHVVNGIFIHSVAGSSQSQYNLAAGDYNMLGQPASHGCIRVCVRDAKWIYDNTGRGTMVTIGDGYYEPFDKPATIKLPYGVNLKDPTDIW